VIAIKVQYFKEIVDTTVYLNIFSQFVEHLHYVELTLLPARWCNIWFCSTRITLYMQKSPRRMPHTQGNHVGYLLECTLQSVRDLTMNWMEELVLYSILNQSTYNKIHEAAFPDTLIFAQLVKKLPDFYGIRRLIAVFSRAHHWSLS
jgi:hypothetical protein